MSRFRVVLTLQAEILAVEADIWWLENRDQAAELFDREFAEAVDKLRSSPTAPLTSVP